MADDAPNMKRVQELGVFDTQTGIVRPVQEAQDNVGSRRRGSRLLVGLVCQSVQHEPEREDRHRSRHHDEQEHGLCGMPPRIAGSKPTDQMQPTHPVSP
jgi:hypothetical protein